MMFDTKTSPPACGRAYRLLTNLYMKKQYVKLHNISQAAMFALASGGEGGRSPLQKKNDVILRACPQAYTPEGSRAAPHLQGAARCLYGGV